MPLWQSALLAISVGVTTGSVGITAGHELSHRSKKWERAAAALVLLGTCNLHFLTIHPAHHSRLGTLLDPNHVGRRSFWSYYPGSIVWEWTSSWAIDRKATLIAAASALAVMGAVGITCGPVAVGAFVIQSFVATSLLQTVNYIEHYGLERRRKYHGGLEKIGVEHSWNSGHRITGWLLFNLPLHGHHHMAGRAPFEELETNGTSPQLPYGYATMVLLAAVPPFWHRVVDPRLDDFHAQTRVS